ncbi:hypothetical protein ACSFM0_005786 [Escherichia coli]|nr:hypothetical protein [Escherichia coli]EEV6722711.1 hypothetical protein [Escherichia coli]EEW5074670.1 hypothetical protein [Escherichia coli]EEY2487151.1 hypothetical protein [Escherichia coli]EEZ7377713.1 hypothetical protein [Escherichia coli]
MDYPEVLAMNMFSSWLVLVILNTILLFRASKSFFSINLFHKSDSNNI